MRILSHSSILVLTLILGACASKPKDYSLFRAENPTSILVLPPLSESTEVNASYSYLSTVTQPLAEQGYYVFPVAVIDQMLKQNGLPTPGEMHQASIKKIASIIGPDAVMYINIKNYGTKYKVIDSTSDVEAEAKIVSAKSGKVLWEGQVRQSWSANAGNQGGLAGMLVGALVAQAINSSTDQSRKVARMANEQLFRAEGQGLLKGPYLTRSSR